MIHQFCHNCMDGFKPIEDCKLPPTISCVCTFINSSCLLSFPSVHFLSSSQRMSRMQAVEAHRPSRRCEAASSAGGEAAEGYVKEYTRHSNDVLLNLNELRHRDILTDATLMVGSARLRAHCAVLVACRYVSLSVNIGC